MSQSRAKAFIRRKALEDAQNLYQQSEDLTESNQEAMRNESIGSFIGRWGAPLALAWLSGGTAPLWSYQAASAAGDYAGGELGESWEGGLDFSGKGVQGGEAIKPVGFRSDIRRDLKTSYDDMYGQFDEGQKMDALQTFLTSYSTFGGGPFTTLGGQEGGLMYQMGQPGKFTPGASLFKLFGVNNDNADADPDMEFWEKMLKDSIMPDESTDVNQVNLLS